MSRPPVDPFRKIPLCVPEIRGNEWPYVKECLDTNWVSSVGPFVDRFEQALASYLGASHGAATVNGTAALHVALLAAGIKPDDEVLVSTLTFIASANVIRYVGAHPVLMDADPLYWQMDAEKVGEFLSRECQWAKGALRNKATGRRVRAIIPVHILGHPVEIDPLLEAARKYGLTVIEDAAEGLGARYKNRMVGHLADIACLSFNGNKIITCGGGGAVISDREDWMGLARHLITQAKDHPTEYIHDRIGYNYRPSNLQAAMGCAQLEQLDAYITKKRRIAKAYRRAFQDIPGLTPMPEAPWAQSTFWLYTVLVEDAFGLGSRQLMRQLSAAGIETRPLWQPLHLSPPHGHCQSYHCEAAERLYHHALSLPCSVGLTPDQQAYVIDRVCGLARP